MKKNCIYIIFCFFIITSCDPVGFTNITFQNESSYDLRIKIVDKYDSDHFLPNSIELMKNRSASSSMGQVPSPPDPKIYIAEIVFSNLYSGAIIKTIDINTENILILISSSSSKDDYLIKITDDFLR